MYYVSKAKKDLVSNLYGNFLLFPIRFVEYSLDSILYDPLKLRARAQFKKLPRPMFNKIYFSYAANGKRYSIFDPIYWNIQWRHWGEQKKIGKRYYPDVANFINKYSKKVFEIGCGPGYLTELLHPSIKYVGIDISPEAIDMAKRKVKRKNFKFFVDTIENMMTYLMDGHFDTFVAIDVLEHLSDKILTQVNKTIMSYRHFKDIYIVTPYLNWVPTPGHISLFSKSKIKDLLATFYSLKFKPYNNYREFLTKGHRRTVQRARI